MNMDVENKNVSVNESGIQMDEIFSFRQSFKNGNFLDVKVETVPPPPDYLASIPHQLPIDELYKISDGQRVRDFSDFDIVKGAKTFDWNLYQPIECAYVDGKYYVFDGQGRVMMACYHPEITHLPAYVKTHIKTKKQLCEAFVNYNQNKTKMTRQDFFIPEATMGVSYAVGFKNLIESTGWKLEREKRVGNEPKTLYVKEQNRLLEVWGTGAYGKKENEIVKKKNETGKKKRKKKNDNDKNRVTNILAALKFAECYTGSKLPSHIPRAIKIICQTYEDGLTNNDKNQCESILEDTIIFNPELFKGVEPKYMPRGFFLESRTDDVVPEKIKLLFDKRAVGRDYKEAYIILSALNDKTNEKEGKKNALFEKMMKAICKEGERILKIRNDRRMRKLSEFLA